MLTNSINNLNLYTQQYPFLKDVVAFIEGNDIATLSEPKTEINDDLYVVSIHDTQAGAGNDDILEAHREWIDVHCTLAGLDKIIFRSVKNCKQVEKEYDAADDYMLFKESSGNTLLIEPGYFCLIAPDMAHMALCGEGAISKVVFKARVK